DRPVVLRRKHRGDVLGRDGRALGADLAGGNGRAGRASGASGGARHGRPTGRAQCDREDRVGRGGAAGGPPPGGGGGKSRRGGSPRGRPTSQGRVDRVLLSVTRHLVTADRRPAPD